MAPFHEAQTSELKQWKSWVVLSVAMTVTFPYFFDSEALFWDDYTLFNGMDIVRESAELGRPWVAPFFLALTGLGTWSYKFLSFLTLIIGYFAFAKILSFHHSLSPNYRFLASAAFVVGPVAFSRVTPAVLTFQVSLVLFLLWWAWFLGFVVRRNASMHHKTIIYGAGLVVALATHGGLLMFLLVPVTHGFLVLRERATGNAPTLAYFKKVWWVLPLPFVVFALTRTVFEPFGRFDGYNSVTLAPLESEATFRLSVFTGVALIGLAIALLLIWRHENLNRRLLPILESAALSMLAFVIWEIADFRDRAFRVWQITDFDEVGNLVLPGIIWLIAAVRLVKVFRTFSPTFNHSESSDNQALWAIGLISMALSYIPYLLVGKPPHPAAFADRLEILIPVALTFLVASLCPVSGAPRLERTLSQLATGVVLTSMLMASAFQFSMMLVDWRKQSLIVEAISASKGLSQASTVLFVDETRFLNWDNRRTPLYESTGWAKSAFGDVGILLVDAELYESYEGKGILEDEDLQKRYGFLGWDSRGKVVEVVFSTHSQKWEVFLGWGEVTVKAIKN